MHFVVVCLSFLFLSYVDIFDAHFIIVSLVNHSGLLRSPALVVRGGY
jgi:hypothetical protein